MISRTARRFPAVSRSRRGSTVGSADPSRKARIGADELDAAHVGDGATVTDVAIGWGFLHPGRFAQAYRKAYGQPPHTTLTG